MHEFAITSQLLETVLREMEKHNAGSVAEVHLLVGELTYLEPRQIRESYRLLTKDTKLADSRLKIVKSKGIVECSTCGYKGPIKVLTDPEYHLVYPTLACPKCGFFAKIVRGRECLVKRIRMVV